jgi:predicted TIM-barrel fold metal-dependent hydrolase
VPFHASGTYEIKPHEVGTAGQYTAVLDSHGVTHALLINPLGGYGTDSTYMLEAMAASDGRFKGVAVIPHDIDDAALRRMDAAGVVGVRYSLHHHTSPMPTGTEGARTLRRLRELGWFAQIHYTGDMLVEVAGELAASGVQLVFDHCGRPVLERGLSQPGFQALLRFGREGQAMVKLSGAFRFTREPWPHADVEPYVAALLEAFTPDRCVWGSDWPFTRMETRVDYGPLLALVSRWLPREEERRKVLGETPARLLRLNPSKGSIP